MYLRLLELFGFKSFARKTTLTFPKGVAAIVGPNGCGKSNVLDAIRWVLGEQSAKALRGAEMADVIFNGNEIISALGVAEVSLTFSECEAQLGTEFNEVCITRRVYRDGHSEYLLNQTTCRLKDIQQLFMDTGIGRSAYSIMEQGKIDQILSSRPEDRRAIFEEAAGITKYKAQRRDALRKLEQTELNLSRLNDIIGEVKRQLASLSRQASKARRYQALHTDLRLLETHFCHEKFCRYNEEFEKTRKEADEARLACETQSVALEEQENLLADKRSQLEHLETLLQNARSELTQSQGRLIQSESRLEFNRERLAENEERLKQSETGLTEAEQNLQEAQAALNAATDQEREALVQLSQEKEQASHAQSELSEVRNQRAKAEQALAQQSRKIGELSGRLDSSRHGLTRTQAEHEASLQRKEMLLKEVSIIEASLEQAVQQLETVRQQVEDATRQVHEEREEAEQAEVIHAKLQKEVVNLDSQERTLQKQLAQTTSRFEALKQVCNEGESLASGTRAALRGGGNEAIDRAHILGVLGNKVEVASEYINAIEAVLGTQLQTILVANQNAAQEILESLTQNRLGQASLGPLSDPTSLENSENNQPKFVLESNETVVSAASVVQTQSPEAKYWLTRMLFNTWIVQDLTQAKAIRAQDPQAVVVTLSGQWISREGIWHGGKNSEENRGQSLLAQRAKLRALSQEMEATQAALASQVALKDSIYTRATEAAQTWREAQARLNTEQTRLSTLQAEVGPLERENKSLLTRQQTFQKELSEFEERTQRIQARFHLLQTEIAEHEQALTQAREQREGMQTALEELRQKESSANECLSTFRVRVATEEQRHTGLIREKQPIFNRCQELTRRIQQQRNVITECRSRVDQAREQSIELEALIESTRTEQTQLEAQVTGCAKNRTDALESVEHLESELRGKRQQLTQHQEKRSAAEVSSEQFRLRQENLQDQITRRYQLDLSTFLPDPAAFREAYLRQESELPSRTTPEAETETVSLESAEVLIQRLSQRLDAIGSVNLDAITEYDALEERSQFLQKQEADLKQAEAELRDIMAKINAVSKERFMETFLQVRDHFSGTFRELFGGGQAALELADSNDPLECGIEITARPPGKPAQSLTLLSGGEKTMTAVALLFAIYMVKPSPFCVLDEMDAPLDESNIARFIKLLDRFAEQSQFVVITHNKRTMARADVLYGVTMEEPGISKLIAVKLNNEGALE